MINELNNNTGLLIIDLQNDYFSDGDWPLEGIDRAAANAGKLLSAFRNKELPVIHVRHENPSDEAPFFRPGSSGAAIHASVSPRDDEAVVLKQQANSFLNTDLKSLLEQQGIEQLLIVGAMSHMCVDAGVRAAADLGYPVGVAHDACATRELEFEGTQVPAAQAHAAFMSALAFAYARIQSTDGWLEELS